MIAPVLATAATVCGMLAAVQADTNADAPCVLGELGSVTVYSLLRLLLPGTLTRTLKLVLAEMLGLVLVPTNTLLPAL